MFDFKFADIGEGIHEGKILEWKYKQGDKVEEGETLVIIETDKVNAEIPIPVDGTIVKLGPPEGEIIHVGDLLARIDDGEGDAEEVSKEKPEEKEESKEDDNIEEDEGGVVGKLESSDEMIESYESKSEKPKSERVLATPVARKLASDLNIDIQEVKGSGEHGRVLKEDIENHKGQSQKQTSTQGQKTVSAPEVKAYESDRREKISSLRKSVVNAMTLSKQVIPHTTLIDELDVTDLVNFRNDHKGKAADEGVKLTYMAFIIKALTKAIKDYPILNASFDQINEEIIYRSC